MATTSMTLNPQLITIPANTTEHDIDVSAVLKTQYGIARIERVSGTSFQINSNDQAITAASPAIVAANPVVEVPIRKSVNIRMKGGSGSETFIIVVTPRPDSYIN